MNQSLFLLLVRLPVGLRPDHNHMFILPSVNSFKSMMVECLMPHCGRSPTFKVIGYNEQQATVADGHKASVRPNDAALDDRGLCVEAAGDPVLCCLLYFMFFIYFLFKK